LTPANARVPQVRDYEFGYRNSAHISDPIALTTAITPPIQQAYNKRLMTEYGGIIYCIVKGLFLGGWPIFAETCSSFQEYFIENFTAEHTYSSLQ
jgi:hypothetical protein